MKGITNDKRRPNDKPGPSPEKEVLPVAGPHAKRHLTNLDATPGSGVLPAVENDDENMQPTG